MEGVSPFLWGRKINFFQMKVAFGVLSPFSPNEKSQSQKWAFWLLGAERPGLL